jgi:hypothetical protein
VDHEIRPRPLGELEQDLRELVRRVRQPHRTPDARDDVADL